MRRKPWISDVPRMSKTAQHRPSPIGAVRERVVGQNLCMGGGCWTGWERLWGRVHVRGCGTGCMGGVVGHNLGSEWLLDMVGVVGQDACKGLWGRVGGMAAAGAAAAASIVVECSCRCTVDYLFVAAIVAVGFFCVISL